MAEKGAYARLHEVAFRLYTADLKSLTEIEAALGVSRQTLAKWKAESKRPDQELDDWDRARAQKRGNIQRLKDLFERQLTYMEEVPPDQVSAPLVDALSKLGALVEKWDKAEQVVKRLGELERAATEGKQAITADTLRQVRAEIYGLA